METRNWRVTWTGGDSEESDFVIGTYPTAGQAMNAVNRHWLDVLSMGSNLIWMDLSDDRVAAEWGGQQYEIRPVPN